MYKFILQFPISILAGIVFTWVFLIFSKIHVPEEWMMIHSLLFLLTGFFWMMGLNGYMNLVLEKNEFDFHSISLILIFSAPTFDIFNVFIGNMPIFTISNSWMEKVIIGFYFLVLILLVIKIKKVLYERSSWFMLLELFFYPFGILTLTPEIRNHYLENKAKIDKLIAGGSDEEILNS